ncbi:helix-turn-helix domain-containing protein [Cronobacter turicensis]|nr:helix-turn-helix domain-containing protein [Cronobacter turicensis]ELY4132936.1 helix-turn-helix domain-containing protein [Cronobacter turicensis]ELY4352583.1 helix-turn-helix domain-containing protein [Cronobacter turicensis]ELY6281061.1 helix-turn-helix domain-containing protein [Cronobacter turicensis]
MPSIPIPLLTLAILLMLLAKVSLSGSRRDQRGAMFLAGCALLVLLTALRWAFDFPALRQLQSFAAMALPPLAWYCFCGLASSQPLRRNLMIVAPVAVALIVNLAFPAATDCALAALYLGYGIALLRTAHKGSDAFSRSRLSDAPTAAKLAFVSGAFLCFSALTDIAIAFDFQFFQGQQAPLLVAVSQAILLPFMCLAILWPARKPAQPAPVAVPALPASDTVSDTAQDAQCCARLEEMLRAQSLYLNPDLTLDLLARKTGTPARHISKAVNATRGCNVSQWINSFRIAHAQQLLRQTREPVTAVMLESGFNTKSNFNREFARIVGMSPMEYRRAAADTPAPDSGTRLSAP